MITRSQRKFFFVFVRRIGKDAAYTVLREVTKGRVDSLRSELLTPWTMTWVLSELIGRYSKELENPANTVQCGDNLILLISRDQRNAIQVLKKILKMGEEEYRGLCTRLIGFEEPLSSDQALLIMGELQERIRRVRCRLKI